MNPRPIRSGRLAAGIFAGWAALSAGAAHASTIPLDRVPVNPDSFSVQTSSNLAGTRLAEDMRSGPVSLEWFGADASSATESYTISRAGRMGLPIGRGEWATPTPEPASLVLTGTGLVLLALRRRRS
jgi:hypothetical protein